MAYEIIQKTSISKKSAKELIMTMAIWGNNNYGLKTEREVIDFFRRRNINIGQLIEQCHTHPSHVPFNNLIGPTWQACGEGQVAIVNSKAGEEFAVYGPGEFTTSDYWGKFNSADQLLRKSIEFKSFQEFQNALINGMASIESYINYRAIEWNGTNPTIPIDIAGRISLDEKVDLWLPIMLNGKRFDKERNKKWSDYQVLKQIRDNTGIHPKQSVSQITYKDLVKLQNLYRSGIAGLLMDLHKLFNERMPVVIIRRYYAPDVVFQEIP